MQKDPGQAGRESAVTAQRSDPAEPGQDGVRSGGTRGVCGRCTVLHMCGSEKEEEVFAEEGRAREERLKLADSATSPRVAEEDKGMVMEGV